MGVKTVFIDRDGTINENTGYINSPNLFKMYPGVAEGVKLLKDKGFKIVIITNQSGIARGLFTKETLEEIHDKMKNEFKEKGASFDAIYYCPHHPDEKCNCRKPRTGLLEKAIRDFDVDLKKSYIIGDRMLDIEAGKKIGVKTVLVPEKIEMVKREMEKSDIVPDHISNDFSLGVKWILENEKSNTLSRGI